MTVTQEQVHAKARVLWDAAMTLPEVECPKCGGQGQYLEMVQTMPDGEGETVVTGCVCIPTEGKVPHPLRVAVEQVVTVLFPDKGILRDAFPVRVLRPYDASDPAEPLAWCGRLWLLKPHFNWEDFNSPCFEWIEDAIRDGDILAALDAAREAVEEVAHG